MYKLLITVFIIAHWTSSFCVSMFVIV